MTTTKPNMHAVAIDQETWPRQPYFYYFTKLAPVVSVSQSIWMLLGL